MMRGGQTSANPGVKSSILLTIAFRNLMHKKLRTGLTVFGISIGIGAIYFLLSFGLGLQHLVTNEVIGNQSIKTIDVNSANSSVVQLDDITTQRIADISDVSEVGKAYYYPGSFKLSSSESDTIVYGIDQGYENLTYLNIIAGKLPSESSEAYPIVVNLSALKSIGLATNPKQIIDKSVEIIVPLNRVDAQLGTFSHNFRVVGVIDSGSGAEVFIPSTIFRDAGVSDLTQLKVGVKDVDNIRVVRSQIESFGFETSSPVDTLDQINTIFKYLNLILVGFGGIGMLIAVLGMFNTLTISLLERTKEIGLMVALGARSVDMRKLFMLEALQLSMFGAVIGILSAFLIGRVVNMVMNVLSHSRGVQSGFDLFANPLWLIGSTILFMMVVGLVVVYLPARRAERINPIDALRRE
ncbi:ABC transporter permease [Candidatus Saccharibacteria bacterium]|nr:ABC transporter permease [Candidatus Saccharibacteria bacterium]